MQYSIEVYEQKNKKRPFDEWLNKQDSSVKYIIISKLERIGLGNLSTCKPLRNGLYEIVIDKGPGYRIYYSKVGNKIILLLCAGMKRTQQPDIDKAEEYLIDYKERSRIHGKK